MPEQIPLMVDAATQELRQFTSDETIPRGQLLSALQVALTGLVTSNVSGVLASDTILQAIGKLQAQASDKVDKVAGKVLSSNDFTDTERVKLTNIAEQATKNATDAALRDRTTHTGTQSPDTIAGLTQWQANPTGVQSINGGQLAGMRNLIINGGMNIAQMGTTFPALANGAYALDGWFRGGGVVSGVLTFEQSADTPSASFTASLKLTVTTADTDITTYEREHVVQRIEGFDIAGLRGKTFVLSFWVRSSKTGVHCVAFRNGYSDLSYVSEYVVNAANTWEYKTITVPGGLITSGNWNYTNGVGLIVGWALAAGTTYHGLADVWQNGDFIATANQVNCLDAVGNVFGITGVQLEPGDTATPFEHRKYSTELAMCKRYFQKSYVSSRFIAGGANITLSYDLPPEVEMRAAPSIAFEWYGARSLVSAVNFSPIRANGSARMDVTSSGAGDCYMLDAVITRSARL
jgi:hypothetical protein